jgi:hypothetical protein
MIPTPEKTLDQLLQAKFCTMPQSGLIKSAHIGKLNNHISGYGGLVMDGDEHVELPRKATSRLTATGVMDRLREIGNVADVLEDSGK